jgi:hypothetical protein
MLELLKYTPILKKIKCIKTIDRHSLFRRRYLDIPRFKEACQDPYFHTLLNSRQCNVSLILLCSSGLALGLRPLLSSLAQAILTQYMECLRSATLLYCLLLSRFFIGSSLVFAGGLLMVLGPGDLIHSMDNQVYESKVVKVDNRLHAR